MPIGEFGGAPPLVAEGSPALTTPMYWMYEMGARVAQSGTRRDRRHENPVSEPAQSVVAHRVRQIDRRGLRIVRAHHAPLRQAGMGPRRPPRSTAFARPVEVRSIWEKPFCRLLYFDRKLTRPLRSAAAARADRGADVRPLRDAAARHGRGLSADA